MRLIAILTNDQNACQDRSFPGTRNAERTIASRINEALVAFVGAMISAK